MALFFGWLACPLLVWRFQVKDFNKGLMVGAAQGYSAMIHFAIIDATSGSIIVGVSATMMLIQALTGQMLSAPVRYGLACMAILIAFVMKEPGWAALFPLLSFSTTRLAEDSRNDLVLRFVMLAGAILWICYSIASGSIPGVVMNTLGGASCVIGLYRFYGPGLGIVKARS